MSSPFSLFAALACTGGVCPCLRVLANILLYLTLLYFTLPCRGRARLPSAAVMRGGRKEGRYATRGNRSTRWARGRAEAAFGQDLLRLWAALGRGRLRRRDPGRERGPVRRGGGHSAWRVGLLPGREASRGGERRPRHRRHLLHGGRQHRPDPRHRAFGSWIRLVGAVPGPRNAHNGPCAAADRGRP